MTIYHLAEMVMLKGKKKRKLRDKIERYYLNQSKTNRRKLNKQKSHIVEENL